MTPPDEVIQARLKWLAGRLERRMKDALQAAGNVARLNPIAYPYAAELETTHRAVAELYGAHLARVLAQLNGKS